MTIFISAITLDVCMKAILVHPRNGLKKQNKSLGIHNKVLPLSHLVTKKINLVQNFCHSLKKRVVESMPSYNAGTDLITIYIFFKPAF